MGHTNKRVLDDGGTNAQKKSPSLEWKRLGSTVDKREDSMTVDLRSKWQVTLI